MKFRADRNMMITPNDLTNREEMADEDETLNMGVPNPPPSERAPDDPVSQQTKPEPPPPPPLKKRR